MANEPRRFCRTLVIVEVLHQEPLEFDSLSELANMMNTGNCSGDYEVQPTETIQPAAMVKLLEAQGTDPKFFGLDKEGNDDL